MAEERPIEKVNKLRLTSSSYLKSASISQQEEKKQGEDHLSDEEAEEEKSLFMTEEGIKRAAKIDYTSKFKDINWTTEIERELPIRMVNDKERRNAVTVPGERLPGSETPITVS